MSELLNIEHLSVSFAAEEGKMEAVRDVSFSLKSGEKCTVQKYHETASEKWMD